MKKYDVIKDCLYLHCPNIESILLKFAAKAKQPSLTTELFILTLSKEEYNLSEELPISANTITKLLKEVFPNRKTNCTGMKPCTYLLGEFWYKWCAHCKEVKEFEDFRQNSSKRFGLNVYCKSCHMETTASTQPGRQSEYRASKLHRTPGWADLIAIKQFYANCPNNMAVDHIIPLQGKSVSGLHVENNLQYLSPADNSAKYNKYSI